MLSRYLALRDYAPVPGDLHLGRLRIPALSFARSISSLHHRRNFTFDNCLQGLKPRFMRPTDAALKGPLFHGGASARRCTGTEITGTGIPGTEMRVKSLLPCSAGEDARAATAVAARELGSRLGARTPACVIGTPRSCRELHH